MPSSTPLERIESNDIPDNQASDEDRVQRIIQEMNGGAEEPPQQASPGRNEESHAPPYQQMPAPQQYQQMPSQQQGQPPMYMQGQQQQMAGHNGQQPYMMPPPAQYGQPQQMHQQNQEEEEQQQRHEPEAPSNMVVTPSKKNIWAHIADIFKLPIVVAIVFFLLNLPIVDVQLAKYAHWAFSSGGHLSMGGMALKAVVAGAVLGIYDTLDKLVSRFF
jgi:hypothetical protein